MILLLKLNVPSSPRNQFAETFRDISSVAGNLFHTCIPSRNWSSDVSLIIYRSTDCANGSFQRQPTMYSAHSGAIVDLMLTSTYQSG